MHRNLIVLILICFFISGCSNKNEIDTTSAIETIDDESETDSSQSPTENNDSLMDQEFEVDKVLNGIAYTLGEKSSATEPSILKLKGTGRNNTDGSLWFQGVLDIDGKEYNLSYETDGINILSYASSAGFTRTYGQVFMNNDLSSVSISITVDGWSNEDGQMLTYPCDTKAEGLEIANKVMEDYLLLMGTPKLK